MRLPTTVTRGSRGMYAYNTTFETQGRLVRVMTSYNRVYPGVRVNSDESSLLTLQINEISDAIRDHLVSLPPAPPGDPEIRSPVAA